MKQARGPGRARLLAGAFRVACFAALWMVLAEGDLRGWWLGLVFAALAAWASLRLAPPGPGRISIRGLVAFVPYFLQVSIRGAVDVAIRAFRSPPAADPAILDLPLRLPGGPAATFLSGVVGLLPGTLGTNLSEDRLKIHVIDRNVDNELEFRRLERRVGALFGVDPATLPPVHDARR